MPHNPPVVLSADEMAIVLIPQGGSGMVPRSTAGADLRRVFEGVRDELNDFLALNVYHQQLSGQAGTGRSTR